MRSYSELIGRHQGEIGFVLGSGTSLFKITKNIDYKDIFNHVTIAINSSILAVSNEIGSDQKKYWTSNDVCSMQWTYWKNVIDSNCKKIIRDSWKNKHEELKPYEDLFFEFTPRSGWKNAPTNINELMFGPGIEEPESDEEKDIAIKEDEIGLCAISSIPSAIDFMIQIGCAKIFLLGVDHYISGRYSHFWEYYPKNIQPRVQLGGFRATHNMQKAMFEQNMKTYSSLNRFAEKRESKIYMCNEKSRVSCFEKIDFNEALKMIK